MKPLSGIRVVEFSNVGPGQLCGRMLCDLGADVIRVGKDAAEHVGQGDFSRLLNEQKRSVVLDLEDKSSLARLLQFIGASDIFLDGFRPGVTEKLGIGPNICMGYNPSLIYGRISGWGQKGPRSNEPGHEINYAATAGSLYPPWTSHAQPESPLCLVSYFAGGLYFLIEILGSLYARSSRGRGQVVDSAMTHSAMHLTTLARALLSSEFMGNLTGFDVIFQAPFYAVYETLDHKYMAVGAPEGKFFNEFARKIDIPWRSPKHLQKDEWPELKNRIAREFKTRTQREWEREFNGSEACVTPVLTPNDRRLQEYTASDYFYEKPR